MKSPSYERSAAFCAVAASPSRRPQICEGSHSIFSSGKRRLISRATCHTGGLRYSLPEVCAKPRCTNTSRSGPTPAVSIRSTAPVHKPVSGICAFFTNTSTSVPRSASATSCTLNGLPVVRAPIHTISAPAPRAASTWRELATSTPNGSPVSAFASASHSRPTSPTP